MADSQLTRVIEVAALSGSDHSGSWNEHVTSLAPFRDGSLLLAGTSSGRLLIVSVVGARVVEDVTAKNQLKLS